MKRRKRNEFKYYLLAVALFMLLFALGFSIFVGLLKLIAWCFGLVFSWKLAIGIWAILIFINLFVRRNNKNDR